MFCQSCGREIAEPATVCPNCGGSEQRQGPRESEKSANFRGALDRHTNSPYCISRVSVLCTRPRAGTINRNDRLKAEQTNKEVAELHLPEEVCQINPSHRCQKVTITHARPQRLRGQDYRSGLREVFVSRYLEFGTELFSKLAQPSGLSHDLS